MNLRTYSLLFAASAWLAVAAPAADAAPAAFPAFTLPGSQLRDLPRNAAGRQYQLHIGLPASYAANPDRRYPVVYVTDGYWDFAKMYANREALTYDKVAPEFIIVGLGYVGEALDYGNLRRWELSPVPFGGGGPEASGHAADFLRTIKTEIIPFVEREYRADSAHRILAGASLGGLFTLYSMYAEPGLFEGYIAATPAVVLGDDWLLGFEEAFVKAGKTLRGRLFVSTGGNEAPGFMGGALRYNARVSSRKYEGLAYQFRIIEGERHAGMQIESYVRGLRFVFAPLAPESGPAADR
ncbi:MAG: alpha/beta hydrolase [Opitutaceae bacterium]|nr:alpha/beta hydrolase [Opitutaceae bacterium]